MMTARVTPTTSTTDLGLAARTVTILNTSPYVDVNVTIGTTDVAVPRGAQATVTSDSVASIDLATTVGVAVVKIEASLQ